MAEKDVSRPGFFDVGEEDIQRREDYGRVMRAAEAAKASLEADGAHEVDVWIIAKSKTGDQIGTNEHQRECASTWSGDFHAQLHALDVLADMCRGVLLAMSRWADERGEDISLHTDPIPFRMKPDDGA